MNANTPEQLITVGRLASEAGIDAGTVRDRVRRGSIVPDFVAEGTSLRGGMVLFRRARTARLIEEIRQSAGPAIS